LKLVYSGCPIVDEPIEIAVGLKDGVPLDPKQVQDILGELNWKENRAVK
jgi:hypothetical protein